ncbi:MAG: outer membrane beta-barrel protein [Bacteroidota bacterium]|nr:outer membrane beta-barrel protein [Bacteroidota bacterium]
MRVAIIAFILLISSGAYAQFGRGDQGGNLPRFYKQHIHFGFSIGVNRTDFRVHTVPNSELYTNHYDSIVYPDDTLSLKSISTKPETGFNLGIICDVRLQEYIRLRFLPNIAFGSRQLIYTFSKPYHNDTTFTTTKKIESTFINFPIDLKIQSKRIGNFGAYVVGGGNYSIDLASQKKQKADDLVVRLKSNDIYYQAGGGVDFYLPYFKLSLEGKVMVGVKNILIQDDKYYTKPIDKLNSHIFLFSITFEG